LTVAGILLAAGTSSRLGRPKALLPYRGSTLLDRALDSLWATACRPCFAVIGPEVEKSCWLRNEANVALVVNSEPGAGLSRSLQLAIHEIEGRALVDEHRVDGLLITLVDQPLVTVEHLSAILSAGAETGLAATSWATAFGPPAFFSRAFFPDLLRLRGDEGARTLLRAERARVRFVEFAEAAFDVDDAGDYERLLSGAKA
jgi:molybdenum cofactor cytidylyltransferase